MSEKRKLTAAKPCSFGRDYRAFLCLLVLLTCTIQTKFSWCKKKLTNRYEKYDFFHFSIVAKSTTQGRESKNRNVQRIRRENAQITTINKTIRMIRQETTAQKTARAMLGLFYFNGKIFQWMKSSWQNITYYQSYTIVYLFSLDTLSTGA